MNREAALLGGAGIRTIVGGGSRAPLEARLTAVDPAGVAAVVSVGLCGGLDATLRVGDVVLASEIAGHDDARLAASDALVREVGAALDRHAVTRVRIAAVAGVDAPLLSPAAKAAVRARTGAAAVDMESHVAAAWATRHVRPFTAIRVVSDDAGTALPAVAGRAMRPDGSIDLVAVIGGLLAAPGELGPLLRTARDARTAFRILGRVGGLLRELAGVADGLHL